VLPPTSSAIPRHSRILESIDPDLLTNRPDVPTSRSALRRSARRFHDPPSAADRRGQSRPRPSLRRLPAIGGHRLGRDGRHHLWRPPLPPPAPIVLAIGTVVFSLLADDSRLAFLRTPATAPLGSAPPLLCTFRRLDADCDLTLLLADAPRQLGDPGRRCRVRPGPPPSCGTMDTSSSFSASTPSLPPSRSSPDHPPPPRSLPMTPGPQILNLSAESIDATRLSSTPRHAQTISPRASTNTSRICSPASRRTPAPMPHNGPSLVKPCRISCAKARPPFSSSAAQPTTRTLPQR